MSFGGSAAGMNHSVQANKALRRGRNSLFEREVIRSYGNWDNKVEHAPVSKEVREKFARKFVQERRMETLKLLLSVLLAIVLIAALYFYGDTLSRLIVHQVGEA